MTGNLFDLDFSRWEVVLLSLVPALINIAIFFYASFKLPENRTNYAFAAFVLLSGLWQLGDGFVRISISPKTALEWFRIALAFSLFVIPFGIRFTLMSSQRVKKTVNNFMFLGQYVPAIICLIFILARQDHYEIEESESWYWVVSPIPTNITLCIYIWLVINAGVMLVLLWINFARSNKLQRNQSLLLAVGFTLPVVGGIIAAAVFPIVFGLDYIPITTPLVTAFTIAAFVSIKNNNLLDYSPKHQWGQIVETMNEGILIVNNYDRIMYANKMFCKLLEYDFEDIKGKVANEMFFDDSEIEKKKKIYKLIEDRKSNISSQYEILLKSKSGKKIWVIINGTPYVDRKGKIVGSIGIHTNIDNTKRSDARFRALVENVGDIISLSSEEGNILYVSPAYEKVTGFSMEDILGKPGLSMVHPDQQKETKAHLEEVLSKPGIPLPRHTRLLHKDGHSVWVEGTITNLLDNENVKAIVSNYRNITERKAAEEKLKHNEERLKAIFDNEPECVKVVGIDCVLLEMNPAGMAMLEAGSEKDVIGQNVIKLIHPDDREIYMDLHRKVCKGESGTADYRIISLKGNQRWMESNAVPLRNEKEEIYASLSVARDITEIKKKNDELLGIKNKLEYSELRLKQAQAIAHVGNWEFNFASNISLWSDEACRIYGFSPENNRLTMEKWMSLMHPEDLDFVKSEIERSRNLYSDISINHRIMHSDGEVRYVNSESRFEFDSTGQPVGLYGVVHDITEEKKAEIRLQNLLNVTSDQNTRLQNFAYIISHNVRSHSANIIGLVDIMSKAEVTKERDKIFGMLKTSTDKLSETIENLNDIITIQNDTNRQKSWLVLKQEVDKTTNAINSILFQSNTTLINNVPDDMEVLVVPSYLESILLNIITNAVKYCSPEKAPVIIVNAGRKNGFIIISIADNGIGIDLKKNGEKIFGMYKTFHHNEDATGFGLYITKNQVEAMGGKIEVESEIGDGSTFKIYIHE